MKPVSVMRYELQPVVDALVFATDETEVQAVLEDHDCSRWDFIDMDSHPGYWGYRESEGGWHWKLRRFRNGPDFNAWWKEARR